MFIFTTNCSMLYERLLATGRFCLDVVGLASLLTSLGFGVWVFERLGNVLDCEEWIFCLALIFYFGKHLRSFIEHFNFF